ncbi:MAG: hypothetical protein AB1407_11690 [Spirochaetota bacterium]
MVLVSEELHGTYGRCLRISNGLALLYVTLDRGPRILHYSLGEGPNMMFVNRDPGYRKSGEEFEKAFYPGAFWDIGGGNRLWIAPHSFPDAFYPDNEPVRFEPIEGGVKFLPPLRIPSRMQICTEVCLDPDSAKVVVRHGIENKNDSERKAAAWSITAVDAGGLEIVPQPRRRTGVLPNRRIALWPYSDMRDPRLGWGGALISLAHDPRVAAPVKVGIDNDEGWACYFNKGHCFVVEYVHRQEEDYPDFGVSYETFADGRMVEMETISPMRTLGPGETLWHEERWNLVPCPVAPDPALEEETLLEIGRIRSFDSSPKG